MDGHCTDSIFKNREVLSPRYLPDRMSNRMEEIKAINQIICESLEGKVTHILISGPPGTGKTAAIKHIFKTLREDTNALLCYVNCFNKSTRMGALYSMVLDFFKEKRPTRKMPSRRGIAYDEMLDSFSKELEKTNTRVVVCLDEVDQLEETKLIHDLIRTRWESGHIQIIGISNNPFIFKDLDPRTKSRLYPLREISFNPYNREQMREIVEVKVRLVVKETKHHILCDLFGRKIWIPKSEIYCGSHVERLGDFGRLIIPKWLAKQKGII